LLSDSPLEVTPDRCFSYPRSGETYGTSNPYRGRREFRRRYYPRVFDLDEKGEEFECACFIDSMDEVEFWVRNIANRPDQSFWLQTSTDKFYPDFVCRLKDRRFLVVEYKGADRWSDDDSREKRAIGEFWERRSNGSCLFVMPKGMSFDEIRAKL
jgi:type III restriction enzyme